MMKVISILLIAAAIFLEGCSHSQWTSVELATQGASWLNPVASVVHFTASAGRAMTDPQDELREKVQHREDEREKEATTEQPGPNRTESK